MQEKNPEYISKIVTHILQGMSQGKTWEESFKELGEKAGIEKGNLQYGSEKQKGPPGKGTAPECEPEIGSALHLEEND